MGGWRQDCWHLLAAALDLDSMVEFVSREQVKSDRTGCPVSSSGLCVYRPHMHTQKIHKENWV